MKTRLGIFIASMLLLPMAGLWLSGAGWSDLVSGTATSEGENITATLRTSLMLLFYLLLTNHTIKRLTGNNPLGVQRNFFFGMSIASALLGWLLSYLNLFVTSWTVQQDNSLLVELLLYTPVFALLAPAILITRALLGSFPGVLKSLAFRTGIAAVSGETLVFVLLPLAVLGLLGGASWPAQLFWLLWAAPLLLLISLQLLWNESTIFTGLRTGDWGRIICTALSGIIVCNLAIVSYQMNSSLHINLPDPLWAQPGFALFGLLCLQLSDVIAENWRGKSRNSQLPQKKKFPIPVVVKRG